MDAIGFLFFSGFESLALIIAVLTMYRFKLTDCFWPAMLVMAAMDLQSFVLREELSLANLVPVINAVLITLLLTIVLEVPIQWAIFVAIGGYALCVVLQAGIVEASFGTLSIEEINSNPGRGYILQSLFSILVYLICRFLYARGIGFAFDFNKRRFKHERMIVTLTIAASLLGFGIVMYKQEVILDILILSAVMLFFLYILFKKEKEAIRKNDRGTI